MKRGHVGIANLSLIAVMLGITGCSTSSTPASTDSGERHTASPSPTGISAHDELVALLTRTKSEAFRFSVKGDLPEGASIRATGGVDPKARQYAATVRITGGKDPAATAETVIGADLYTRDLDEKQWLHVDLSQLKSDPLSFDKDDPTGLARLIERIALVRRTGPHAYSGQFVPAVSFTASLPIGAPAFAAVSLAGAVDFSAITNEHGWVTSITIDMKPTDGPPLHMTTTLTGHGDKLDVKRPPKSQVQEGQLLF